MFSLPRNHHPCPKPPWDKAPEEDEDGVAPVDDLHALALLYRLDDALCHVLGIELQGIVAAGDEVGLDKAGANVGDGNVQVAHASQLAETFEIMTLEALGRRVGWGGAKALGASDGGDAGDAGSGVPFGEPVEGGAHHPHEPHAIGLDGLQLLIQVERVVLPTDARTMKIQVHAAKVAYELEQTLRGIGRRDIYLLIAHYAFVAPLDGFETFNPSARDADLPPSLRQEFCHFHSDARRGTHHDCFPCHSSVSFYACILKLLVPC